MESAAIANKPGTSFAIKPGTSPERQALYGRLDQKNTAPLWEVLSRLVPPEPQPVCVPALWKYDELRPLLMEATRLITAKEAERRGVGAGKTRRRRGPPRTDRPAARP